MNDPNRIVERVRKLVLTAAQALEEADGIVDNAEDDEEDPQVIAAARKFLEEGP